MALYMGSLGTASNWISLGFFASFFIWDSDDGGSNYDAEVVPLTSHNDIIETDATECPDLADIGSYSCPFGCPVEFSLEAAIGGAYDNKDAGEWPSEGALDAEAPAYSKKMFLLRMLLLVTIMTTRTPESVLHKVRWLLRPPPIGKCLVIPLILMHAILLKVCLGSIILMHVPLWLRIPLLLTIWLNVYLPPLILMHAL